MCIKGCSDMGGHNIDLRIASLGLVLGWGNSIGAMLFGQYGNINDLMGAILDFSGFCVLLLFFLLSQYLSFFRVILSIVFELCLTLFIIPIFLFLGLFYPLFFSYCFTSIHCFVASSWRIVLKSYSD
jgi:hypothetical protein